MTRLSVLVTMLFLAGSAISQEPRSLTGLINTEKQFAAAAAEKNTRFAFLSFLDSAGVVFANGEIKNGIQSWTARQVPKNKLFWKPEFASSSGDLGFTTGPWQLKTSADSVLATGYYSTIWKYTPQHGWKFLADLGTSCEINYLEISGLKSRQIKAFKKTGSVLQAENTFIDQYNTSGRSAFKTALSKDAWFNINGLPPRAGKEIATSLLDSIPEGMKFTPVKAGRGSSGDIGYVYGIVELGNKKENYLRVWENTKDGYKILLQTLRW